MAWAKVLISLLILGTICAAVLAEKKAEEKIEEKKDEAEEEESEASEEDIEELKHLLELEGKLSEKINAYCDSEIKRLQKLKDLAKDTKEAPKDLINNPISVYLLIKRTLSSDLINTIKHNTVDEVMEDIMELLPTDGDLEKAALELLELQDEHKVDTKDMANGDIPGSPSTRPLTVDECYHLGRIAYNNGDYYHASLWMQETLERMKLRKNTDASEQIPVLDYLAFALYKQDNVERAWWVTKQLLKIEPSNARAKSNIKFYEDELKESKLKVPKSEKDLPPIVYDTPGEILDV